MLGGKFSQRLPLSGCRYLLIISHFDYRQTGYQRAFVDKAKAVMSLQLAEIVTSHLRRTETIRYEYVNET